MKSIAIDYLEDHSGTSNKWYVAISGEVVILGRTVDISLTGHGPIGRLQAMAPCSKAVATQKVTAKLRKSYNPAGNMPAVIEEGIVRVVREQIIDSVDLSIHQDGSPGIWLHVTEKLMTPATPKARPTDASWAGDW